MSNMPFKDAIPLAGSVQPIAREYSQFLFNTAYSPLSPLKGAAIVQSMQKIFQTCACIFTFSQRYSTQFTAESRVVFKMHDLLQKKCSRYSSLFGKYISQVSVALSCTKCVDSLQVCYFFPHITVWGSCFSLGSRRSPPSAAAAPHSSLLITHSLITHSLTPSLTHSLLTHSLSHSLTHSFTPLTHSLTEELRSPLEELRRAWAPLGRGSLSCGRCSTHSFLGHAKRSQEALCTAPATRKAAAAQRRPRAPQLRQEAVCSAPATRNAARKLCVLHLPGERQPRPSGGHARRSSARRLCVLRLPRETQPGSSVCHEKGSRGPVAATHAAAPPGGSVYCACHAKRSQEALCTAPARRKAAAAQRRPPLGRGCLSPGRCSTQSFLAAFRVAGAVHRASWRSCGVRGRHWAAAAFLVAHRASWLRFAWQAQYTEPPGGAAARVAAAGPRLPFSWQVQYTELPGCVSRGRRSTQSLLAELRREWPQLGPRLLSRGRRHLSFTPHHAPLITSHSSLLTYHSHSSLTTYHISLIIHHSSLHHISLPTYHCLITPYHIPTHHSSACHTSLITAPLHHHSSTSHASTSHHFSRVHFSSQLITTHHSSTHHHNPSQLHFSHLTYHITTSHHNSSQLITSQLITAPLFTPLLTPHFSHLTYHITTHHSSTSHTIFHTPSLTHHILHTIFHTHNFVTHHLWYTIFHTLLCHTHTIFHTQLCHTPSFTHHLSHTIFHTQLCHTPSFAHHLSHIIFHTQLCHTIFPPPPPLSFPSFPVPATTFLAHYWKKLTCGVIRSFYLATRASRWFGRQSQEGISKIQSGMEAAPFPFRKKNTSLGSSFSGEFSRTKVGTYQNLSFPVLYKHIYIYI